jgi:hypothetical protein
MRNRLSGFTVLIVTICFAASAFAQGKPAAPDETGFTSYIEFGGTANALGQVYELNSSIGYTFTQHFGMDLGVPVYFVNASSSTTGGTSGSGVGNPSVDLGVGNPSVDLRWKYLHPAINFASVVTGSAPLGDSKLGLSTGRATFDWTNRFDRTFSQVTPFLEAGFSNTTSDSRLFLRPYTTLGLNTHFRGGAEVNVWKSLNVGGSAYDILPFGNQTVFSRVTGTPSGNGAGASRGRNFQASQQTTGTADIARDNGFSTWLDASLNSYVDAELGYTRSVHYDLNSISFSLGFNVGRLVRRSEHQ